MRKWIVLIVAGLLSVSIALAQVPERHRGPAAATDIIIQQEPDEPLVIPAGVVWWVAVSGWAAIIGLIGIVWKRHNDDITELKESHVNLAEKVDRHYEGIMTAIASEGKR